MATSPGVEEDIEPSCHLHPLGCPRFRCRECRRSTTSQAGRCFDCLAGEAEPPRQDIPATCSRCHEARTIVARYLGDSAGLCAPCALRGD